MLKLIRLVLFLLYDYYKKGKDSEIAYLSAKLTFIGLIFVNVLTIIGFIGFGITSIVPYSYNDPRWMQYLKLALYQFIPLYLIISFIINKDSVIKLKYNEGTVEKGKVLLIIYIALSIIALFIWV
jgi:hypothetical protein